MDFGATSPGFVNRKIDSRDILILFLIGVLGQILLIANPGYYSHDEWQRFDNYLNNGFFSYIAQSSQIHAGASFGTPVRPVAFALQGIHNLFFQSFPFVVHLISAVNTIIVSIIVYFACINLGLTRKVALVAGALFTLNPLAVLATGWSAALMDQLYFTFGLVTFLLAVRYVFNSKKEILVLVSVAAGGMFSVLSKETGIVFPALLLLLIALFPKQLLSRWRRLFLVAGVWLLPIVLYLLYRIAAIENSFGGAAEDPYAASFLNIGKNIFAYWIYPFHPFITEAHNWTLQSTWSITLSFTIHVALVLILAFCYGFRYSLIYIISYFLFLLPVLFLQNQGSHYMFASAAPLSVALASLILNKNKLVKFFSIFATSILLWHGFAFQKQIYETGLCMNRISTSLEANHASAGFPGDVFFTSDWDAPTTILLRLIHDRNRIGEHGNITFHTPSPSQQPIKDSLILNLNKHCLLSVVNYNLSVEDFGPKFTTAGVNPNKQPDGSIGLWIKVNSTQGFSQAQVYFDDKAALATSVEDKIITAAIDPKYISKPGKHVLTLRLPSRDDIQQIGVFEVKASD
ncbi:hypothetical protein [Paraburkholderia hayleyella]|uniref:hypothetical protein n=1 Tax=Paraburkholderia hayleyella TaxID=2152889 RepID=UPI001291856D|nr:hypothetical protein [Paraburkholderia hayleyella]